MPRITPWEETGLRPFLPLLSSRFSDLVVLSGGAPETSAAIINFVHSETGDFSALWRAATNFTECVRWISFDPNRILDRIPRGGSLGLIVLPSVFADLSGREIRQELWALWSMLSPGDMLFHGCGASPGRRKLIPLSGLRRHLYFRHLRKSSRAYVCLGRGEHNDTLKLVASQYGLQRRFIKHAVAGMPPLRSAAHMILSVLGAYPWLEKEHILVAEK